MNRFSLLFIFVLLISCGAQKKTVTPELVTTYLPKLNEVSNVEIGITLVTKGKGLHYDGLEITKEFKTKVGYELITIKKGTIFLNYDYTKKYDLYSNNNYRTFGIAISRIGENTSLYRSSKSDTGIYSNRMNGSNIIFKPNNEKIEFKKTIVPIKEKDYFKQEFIYNGRVGDALKFIYREFIDDYARPAFTQNLQYDISESNIIGFRGLRIEIIKATNTKIDYKVLAHFED